MNTAIPKGRQAATKPAKRRKLNQYGKSGLQGAISREREFLPSDSPRIRPTLPTLKFLQRGGR